MKEGARVRELFAAHPSVKITERRESQATKSVLLDDFRSGQYDVLHYAGHAGFDRAQPSRSGILCHGGAVLSGADLASLGKLPSLILFFNACESGRVRKAGPAPKPKPLGKRIDENVGLAGAPPAAARPTTSARIGRSAMTPRSPLRRRFTPK